MRRLYKIFGPRPQRALALLDEGASKQEVLERTDHTVGVRDASFQVAEGEVFVIMGLSGSGKSTLVRCLNRLIEPTRGEILIEGEPILEVSPARLLALRRERVGMVFQRFALLPHRTVLQNVSYGLEVQGVGASGIRERAREVLAGVGLEGYAGSYPDQLSGGMQQRVGLARALATEPEILLMDEPFSALDPLIRREMQDELLDLQERLHKTIVFITHDLDEALKLGDRIAIMKDGRIVQTGAPEEILLQPASGYVEAFVEDVDRSRVLTARDVMQPPDALVRISHAPGVALREMERHGYSSVFVVGRGRRLEGIATADEVLPAVRRKASDLSDVVQRDIPTTSPDTPLRELIPLAVRARFPIAVIGGDHRLQGIIVRVSLLSGMLDEPPEREASAEAAGGEGTLTDRGRATAGAGEGERESEDLNDLPPVLDPTGPSGKRTDPPDPED